MVTLTVKRETPFVAAEAKQRASSREVVAFCPGCKAFQTIWFNNDKLIPTRKFSQKGNEIYHDCGSSQSCRLYLIY